MAAGSPLMASALYGADPTAARPTASPNPDHQGRPEPNTDTTGPRPRSQSPILAVVVLLALVVLLTQVSFRGAVQLDG